MTKHVCKPDDPVGRESQMVVLWYDDSTQPSVWCDPCIVDLIVALNRSDDLRTDASCCGHGRRPGFISLRDGRWLVIATREEWEQIDALFPVDINGALVEVTTHCPDCGEEIDPTTCHCGDQIDRFVAHADDHMAVPTGCRCLFEDHNPAATLRQRWAEARAEVARLKAELESERQRRDQWQRAAGRNAELYSSVCTEREALVMKLRAADAELARLRAERLAEDAVIEAAELATDAQKLTSRADRARYESLVWRAVDALRAARAGKDGT